MTEAYVMEKLPRSMIVSEGARAMSMSRRGPRRLTRENAQKAVNVRWGLVRMAKSLGVNDTRKMTKEQLNKAIEKVFDD